MLNIILIIKIKEMEIDFSYKGISTTIQCNPNDNIRDAYEKFSNKREVNLNSLYFLYDGKNLQTNSKIEEIMNNEDKKRKKMNIIYYHYCPIIR